MEFICNFYNSYRFINPSVGGSTIDTMVLWMGSTAYVPQKQFCIIALQSIHSVVSHVFPLSALFSNIVNTMEERK